MGSAAIKSYEEDGLKNPTAVASCMKHYLGYSASRTGKDRTPAYIPEIEMREYYLPQFRDAVKAGSSSIMINSGEINGEPVHASKYLLTDVLRKELGFQGLIVRCASPSAAPSGVAPTPIFSVCNAAPPCVSMMWPCPRWPCRVASSCRALNWRRLAIARSAAWQTAP